MSTLWMRVVDADFRRIANASVRAATDHTGAISLHAEEDRWVGRSNPGDRVTIQVEANGYEPETHAIVPREEVTQVVVGLRRPGQLSYGYGNDRRAFSPVEDAFLIRVRGTDARRIFLRVTAAQALTWLPVSPRAEGATDDLFARVRGNMQTARELTKELTQDGLDVQISRVIEHDDRPALGLTNEVVVRFADDVERPDADQLAENSGLRITREVQHAGNTYVLARDGEPSYDVLRAAENLSRSSRVIYVEPNLTFVAETDAHTPNDPLWAQVPHLKLINADDAWGLLSNESLVLCGGSPHITIAVVDPQGVAPNHPDLMANLTDGSCKLDSSTNFAGPSVMPQSVSALGGDHGTQCAGSATAAFDDNRGLPGVAPNCHLIGARMGEATDAVLMADIYLWVAGFLNGSTTPCFPLVPPVRAADVISSSWGTSGLPLSNTTRDCFDYLTTYGRAGKGCVLCFSPDSYSGYRDFTNSADPRFRAWPTYAKTLGVGSSINANPTNPVAPWSYFTDPAGANPIPVSVDTRSLYSPYGATELRKPDLVAPSHTTWSRNGPIDPILSAVRVGTGTVNGCQNPVPACNDYSKSFGGTSHSTPTVAGAVALILSANPGLDWVSVRKILRDTCVRIDIAQLDLIGKWLNLDGDLRPDYSRWYGAGRLDVGAAIAMALGVSHPLPPFQLQVR